MIACVVNSRLKQRWERERVAEQLGRQHKVQVLFTERPGHAVALARQAAANGCGVVVAVGGDGTLHEVLQGIVEFVSAAAATPNGNGNSQGSGGAVEAGEIPAAALAAAPALATLPWGTGNDFARGLGLLDGGVDPVAALSQALSRPQTPIGLCSVTYCPPPGDPAGNQQHQRRYFLNICDCGVSASASRLMPPLRRLGSTLAYSLAGALALLRHRRQCAQLRLDGGEWRELRGLALVAAGQGRFFGGSMQILPGADPRSGVLRVAVLDGITLWHFLRYQRRLRAGELEGIKGVSFLTGTRLELRPARDGDLDACSAAPEHLRQQRDQLWRYLPVECDGEVVGSAPLTIKVLPQALRFCI